MQINSKSIVIASQQDWGEMLISKHHYAITFAELGYKVYYLVTPARRNSFGKEEINLKRIQDFPNITIIYTKVFFPYTIRFKSKYLYALLIKKHLKNVFNSVGEIPFLVVSFDLSLALPLACFPKECKKVAFAADNTVGQNFIAKADCLVSITQEILNHFIDPAIPKLLLNHGVKEYFVNHQPWIKPKTFKIGLSGNFLRADIDRKTLLQIIQAFKEVEFHFWGSYKKSVNSLGFIDDVDTDNFIHALEKLDNVILYGVTQQQELALGLHKMDAYLICYDVHLDQSKGTNYHKIMEYLACGRVIIANNVSRYAGTDLVEMCQSRESNNEMFEMIKKIIDNIENYNSKENCNKRINFALQNTYKSQAIKLLDFVNNSHTQVHH